MERLSDKAARSIVVEKDACRNVLFVYDQILSGRKSGQLDQFTRHNSKHLNRNRNKKKNCCSSDLYCVIKCFVDFLSHSK